MAVHIDTASMASPRHYSSQVLNHLGLVAGMYDELGLGELIDQVLVRSAPARDPLSNPRAGHVPRIVGEVEVENRSIYGTRPSKPEPPYLKKEIYS